MEDKFLNERELDVYVLGLLDVMKMGYRNMFGKLKLLDDNANQEDFFKMLAEKVKKDLMKKDK